MIQDDDELLIKVEGISKKFCRDLKTSLKYGVYDLGSEFFGKRKKQRDELRPNEFWAIKDISFELRRGQCLGLIGKNGAGKSTLLKLLTGLIKPDHGKIEMRGKVTALIELGSGFNPILTGRENIYNNAMVLGFKRKEVDLIFDEIVDFSEVADFIDSPLYNYSSGMKVRLGFSVAVHLKPDILILDEVLSVGDAGFKMKSLNKMRDIIKNSSVIFVNHSMATVSRICNQIMFLKNSKVKYYGENVMKGIELYSEQFEDQVGRIEYNKEAQIHEVKILSNNPRGVDAKNKPIIHYQDDFIVEIKYKLDSNIPDHILGFGFVNKDFIAFAAYQSSKISNTISGENYVRITIPKIELTNGDYSLNIFISKPKEDKRHYNYATYIYWSGFKVVGIEEIITVPFLISGNVQVINL